MLKLVQNQMIDYSIEFINRFVNGERVFKSRSTRREREDVSFSMIQLINDACGIHSDGIPVGEFYPARYKREKKRRERYWKNVNDGKTTDTRRGFDKYRKEKMK